MWKLHARCRSGHGRDDMKALIIDAADYSFDFLMEPRAPHDLEADPLQLGDALVGEVEGLCRPLELGANQGKSS
jgi:hypothetical protein